MPERGGVGAARPCWPPRLAVIDPVSACLNGFAADIMGSYTHYPRPGMDMPVMHWTPAISPSTLTWYTGISSCRGKGISSSGP
jgi:hypothetical protein